MLPFIQIPAIELGPLPIQVFGVLVAVGILLGTSVAARYVTRYNGDEEALRFIGIRVIVCGFITCHLLDVFFYTPGKVLEDPLLIFRVWEGIASYGGILGATLAFTYYAKKMDLHYLRYGDAVVYGFVLGFTFGRMGCATAHDHIGVRTDFPLGVLLPKNFVLPDGKGGVGAHDLGLYEVFICATIFIVLTLIVKFWTTRRPGTLIAVTAFLYAPIRFGLDFLRFPESDPLYWGLTPAQHLCIWTVVGGIVTVNAMRKPYNQGLFFDEAKTAHSGLESSRSMSSSAAGSTSANHKTKAKVVRRKRK